MLHEVPPPPAHSGDANHPGDISPAEKERVQNARKEIEHAIVILSKLHVLNVARLGELEILALRKHTTENRGIRQAECEAIVAEQQVIDKMGKPACDGGIPLDKREFQTWLHLKTLIDAETPLIDRSRLPPIDINFRPIDVKVFPIQRPHPQDLRWVQRRIERSLIPGLARIIGEHNHAYDLPDNGIVLCKRHISDLCEVLMIQHLKLAVLKQDKFGTIWD